MSNQAARNRSGKIAGADRRRFRLGAADTQRHPVERSRTRGHGDGGRSLSSPPSASATRCPTSSPSTSRCRAWTASPSCARSWRSGRSRWSSAPARPSRLGHADAGAGGRRGRRDHQAARRHRRSSCSDSRMRICDAVKAAAQAKLRDRRRGASRADGRGEARRRRRCIPRPPSGRGRLARRATEAGSSASAPRPAAPKRCARCCEALPPTCPASSSSSTCRRSSPPPSPAGSTASAQIAVKEAEDGDAVVAGRVLIAPGQPPHAAAAHRQPLLRRDQGRAPVSPPPALGRRAVPLGRAERRRRTPSASS